MLTWANQYSGNQPHTGYFIGLVSSCPTCAWQWAATSAAPAYTDWLTGYPSVPSPCWTSPYGNTCNATCSSISYRQQASTPIPHVGGRKLASIRTTWAHGWLNLPCSGQETLGMAAICRYK